MTETPGAAPELHVAHVVPPSTRTDLIDALAADGRVPANAITQGSTPEQTRKRFREAAMVATFTIPEDILASASNLGLVQALSAGVGSYDHGALAEADVALANLSGVHAEPIAEQVLGYMLTFARKLHVGARNQREGVWHRYRGEELNGKTLGIVGVGAIGSRVAELGSALGMEVLGTKRDTDEVPEGVDELFGPSREELYEVLRRTDYLVLACPLTDETEGLVGTRELRTLHREAVLVNVGRGPVVDEKALIRSLQGDRLRGAALDVFETEPLPSESPLWDLPNALVTPHQSGSTPQWPERAAAVVAANYLAIDEGEHFLNRVV
jgi:phosphoglycerate dehydrogenase-like enzyme